MSRFFQRFFFVLAVAIFATLGFGFALGQLGLLGVRAGGEKDGAYHQIGVYTQVLRRIQGDYVTVPNMQNVTDGALHGLLESLDPDSSYLTPTEYKIYKEHPTVGMAHIGATISKRFGYATVVSVEPGSPAAKAKLTDGDVIEAIGGRSTREMSLAVIRLMIEGKPGTDVDLSIIRPRKPDPDKISITRALFTAPSLSEQQYENSTILYLKPEVLTAERVNQLAKRIKEAPKNTKILLDLRDCSIGPAKEGLRLANFFIQKGTLATLEGQKFPRQTFSADPSVYLSAAPLAVLVNRGTFGAAELAAAAILDNKRGDVVGERTFGEGSVQKTIELPDGAALLLTVAKYESPDGKKIEDDAVTPNVLVGENTQDAYDIDQSTKKEDEPLIKALSLLKAKNS